VLLALGLALMFGGPLLAGFVPGAALWTDKDEEALQKASVEYHAAQHAGHDHEGEREASASRSGAGEREASASRSGDTASDSSPAADGTLAAAKQNYDREESRLAAAQAAPGWIALACRVIGVLTAAGGIGIYLKSRASSA
jgi:hypothetical protein